MKAAGIAGVGLVAPGIENWQYAKQFLTAEMNYDISAAFPQLKLPLLSANERRRTTDTIKVALDCGLQAIADIDSATAGRFSDSGLSSVFASSCGDLNIVDGILNALTLPGKPVSPTCFHNSVHNAPAGYWSIASKSSAASTSIAAGEYTFSVGLLEALTQVEVYQHAVLYVAYDVVPPPLLRKHTDIAVSYGVAILLQPELKDWSIVAKVDASNSSLTTLENHGLEQLRTANPAANSLPLLDALANQRPGKICVPYLHNQGLILSIHRNTGRYD